MKTLDTERALQEGAKLWAQVYTEPPEMTDVIWILLQEAAETQKSLRADRPSTRTGYWPEIVWTASDFEAAAKEKYTEALSALKDGAIPDEIFLVENKGRPQATAAAIRRYDTVMSWLKYIRRATNKARAMELMIALAGGLSLTAATRAPRFSVLQLGTRQGVAMFKKRSLEQIERQIKIDCPKIIVGVYA